MSSRTNIIDRIKKKQERRFHEHQFTHVDPLYTQLHAIPFQPPKLRFVSLSLQRLVVTYSEPVSNGGEEITSYWVELDPTPTFDDPITEAFRCPNSPDYATWVVETSSNATIIDG